MYGFSASRHGLVLSDEIRDLAMARGARHIVVEGHRIRGRRTWLPAQAAHLTDGQALRELVPDVADHDRFPCVRLAYRALECGGSMPAVLNAANEEAVAAFLDGRVPFPAIADTIAEVTDAHDTLALHSLEDVLEADAWARARSRSILERHAAARAVS